MARQSLRSAALSEQVRHYDTTLVMTAEDSGKVQFSLDFENKKKERGASL